MADSFTLNLAYTSPVFKPGRRASSVHGPEQKPAWLHTPEDDNYPLMFSRDRGG